MKQLPLAANFLLFIALCASLAYWGMQLFKPATRPVAPPPQVVEQEVRLDAAASLFGGQSGTAIAAVASNYELKGVLMSGTAGESSAILSADGKPPVAVAVNREVMPGVVVKEVHPQYVVISEHGITKRVELPKDAQSNLIVPGPVATRPVPGPQGEPVPPGPGAEATDPSAAPGMAPMPGYAGAPPVMQAFPQGQPIAPPGEVTRIPAPGPRE